MKTYGKPIILCGVIAFLILLNVQAVNAHKWSSWHWDKNVLGVGIWNCVSEGNYAIWQWDVNTDLSLPRKSYHTDISGDCRNYGNTGWGGLATIKASSFDFWHCFASCRIEHAHAIVNLNTPKNWWTKTGIYCQEFGHTFGLMHSNTGDCMGKGYYNQVNVSGPHNWNDINSMY